MPYERNPKVKNTWWIKIWTKDLLTGSLIAKGTMEDLGFMVAMACLATECRGDYGWIQANPETPFTHKYIAGRFNISEESFDRLLKRQIDEERMIENERGILVDNLEFYQKIKGVSNKEAEKNNWKPEPISPTIQDAKEKKQTAIGVVKQTQTAVDALGDLGLTVVDKHTGEKLQTTKELDNGSKPDAE